MSVRIELPGAQGTVDGNRDVTAGVSFDGGVATGVAIGPNARKYFESIGATITEESDPLANLQVGDKLLIDCTVPELRDLAQTEGLDVPAKATKKDILRLFLDAFTRED